MVSNSHSNSHEDNPSPQATAKLYVYLPEDTPSQRATPAVLNSISEPQFKCISENSIQKRERANKVCLHKLQSKERPASDFNTSPPIASRLQIFSSKLIEISHTGVRSALRLRGKIVRQQSINEERSASSSGLWGDANHVFVKDAPGRDSYLYNHAPLACQHRDKPAQSPWFTSRKQITFFLHHFATGRHPGLEHPRRREI